MAGGTKAPDPVVAPPPPKVPLIVKVVDGFGLPLVGAEVEVLNLPTDPKKKPTLDGGLAQFGKVDPRRAFDIKVRKTGFGPPGTPFTPGDNGAKRHPPTNGKPIVIPLTQNLAKFRVRVLTPAPAESPIPAAIIGIDGITGAPPLPQTDGNGNSQLFLLPPGQFRFHAQKNGFGPQPVGNAKFQKDQEVVGFVTLVDGDIRTEVLHLTRFVAKLTINVVSPPPPGGLSGPDVPLDDAEVGVDGLTGPGFLKTKNGGKVTLDIPAGQAFHIRARKNGFGKPVSSGNVINLSFDEGDVPALAEDEQKEVTLRLVEAGQVNPVITPTPGLPAGDAIIVLVKKPHTTPKRWRINLKADSPFGGTGVLRMENPSGSVKIFRSQTGTDELTFDAKKEIAITNTAIAGTGVDVFVEAAAATTKLADLKLTLELRGGFRVILPPVSIKVTCVDLTLDICRTRNVAAADPPVMNAADKINVGRFLHRQVNSKHGRALMFVRKPVPADFAGTLTVKPVVPSGVVNPVLLFDAETAGTQLGNPHDIVATFDAAHPPRIFAEGGTSSSTKVNETGFTIGIKGIDEDQGDRVAITVVGFSNLKASVPTTQENQTRTVAPMGSNATIPLRNDLTVGSGGAANGFDEDFFSVVGTNTLVLMENSIKGAAAAHFVELSASILPDKPEVRALIKWKARRDTRPAPLGDAPGISTLAPAPNARPTVTPTVPDPLKATMLADSVGSFHVAMFLDVDGNGEWDFNDAATGARIDREPFILMCFILVRAQGILNASAPLDAPVNQPTGIGSPAATSANGVQFSSGVFAVGGSASNNDATVILVGGGRNGRLGLDRVFGQWIQGSTGFNSVHTYQQTLPPPAPPVNHVVTAFFSAQALGQASPGGSPNTVTFFVAPPVGVAPPFPTSIIVAPGAGTVAPLATPILDVTKFGNEGIGGNTCVGTDGTQGGSVAVVRNDRPLGEDRRYRMFDSPGWGASSIHPGGQPGQLTSFTFNMNFRIDLCFWTNIAVPANPTATNDPACRLYVTVVTNRWAVNFSINFNPAGGVGVPSPRPWVTMNPEVVPVGAGRLARAIDRGSEPVEVRFPIFTRSWSADAST
jgi:hypothetical protein